MTGPRILTLDIETSPNVAHVWGLFNQTVSLNQLRESTRVMCWAAKWYGKKPVEFRSEFHDGHDVVVSRMHRLLDEADAVVHYNGKRFDMPHLYREMLLAGLTPPSPVQQIDLLQVVRAQFRFTSNKLQHVATELGLGSKASTGGHELWVKCMAGNAWAWGQMRKYNKQDVVLTEQLYDKLLPWIKVHPHHGLFDGAAADGCPNCGSTDRQKRGFAHTAQSTFQQYRCDGCGKWYRSTKATDRVATRSIA